jgi:hypothetical protein
MIKPTIKEVKDWLLSTVRHCCFVEYFLHKLNWGKEDPNRPHDIVGPGNKFSWSVLEGLAVQHRSDDPEFFIKNVLPSIEIHRQQFHHQKWNIPNVHDRHEDMEVGAVDAICSLLEYRRYQGGAHSLDEIPKIIKGIEIGRVRLIWTVEPERAKWMWRAYKHMKKIPIPDTKLIKSLDKIPNIGLPEKTYKKILSRLKETLKMLKKHGYEL